MQQDDFTKMVHGIGLDWIGRERGGEKESSQTTHKRHHDTSSVPNLHNTKQARTQDSTAISQDGRAVVYKIQYTIKRILWHWGSVTASQYFPWTEQNFRQWLELENVKCSEHEGLVWKLNFYTITNVSRWTTEKRLLWRWPRNQRLENGEFNSFFIKTLNFFYKESCVCMLLCFALRGGVRGLLCLGCGRLAQRTPRLRGRQATASGRAGFRLACTGRGCDMRLWCRLGFRGSRGRSGGRLDGGWRIDGCWRRAVFLSEDSLWRRKKLEAFLCRRFEGRWRGQRCFCRHRGFFWRLRGCHWWEREREREKRERER